MVIFQREFNSVPGWSEHTIVSSILTDLIFKRNNGRRTVSSESIFERKAEIE
jgi:hypothetical protein